MRALALILMICLAYGVGLQVGHDAGIREARGLIQAAQLADVAALAGNDADGESAPADDDEVRTADWPGEE